MNDIDFVIPWVDGSDPKWQQKKANYLGTPEMDDRVQRYRDWGLMKFWFRGVENYAPWVRYIWFICDQEPPAWLNTDHPKIRIVRHEDYIPEQYLPVFSANPIELNIHRIRGLSEQFVYFNDDMFIIAPIKETDFFRNNYPKDCALLNPIPTTDLKKDNGCQKIFTIHLNNAEYANRDYDFHKVIKQHWIKWFNIRYGKSMLRNLLLCAWPRFVGFYEQHLPQPYLKSAFTEAWSVDQDILDETSKHAIRNDRDVNQWLIRHRQLIEGKFAPGKPYKNAVFDLKKQSEEAAETIKKQRVPMICLNDGEIEEAEFSSIRDLLNYAFNQILPQTCAFEHETNKLI